MLPERVKTQDSKYQPNSIVKNAVKQIKWTSLSFFNDDEDEKAFSQISQKYFFSCVWTRVWDLRPCISTKVWHWYSNGFSPLWTFMWFFNVCILTKDCFLLSLIFLDFHFLPMLPERVKTHDSKSQANSIVKKLSNKSNLRISVRRT